MNVKINFNDLSVIRGLAALYVVFNHARGHLFAGGNYLSSIKELDWFDKANLALLQLTSLGQEAVILFFVLSGFSIAHSLNRNGSVANFIKNRFIRIYPPYFFSLLFVIFLAQVFSNWDGSVNYLSSNNITKYLLYAKSDGSFTAQYWSLVYEVIFYLLAPLLLIRSRLFVFSMFFSIVFYSLSYFYGSGFITSKNIILSFFSDIFIYFMIGIYTYNNFSKLGKLKCKNKTYFYMICILLFMIILVMKKILAFDPKLTSLLVAVSSIFIIVNVNNLDVKSKGLIFLGEISYSLYLNHFVVIVFAENVLYYYFNVARNDMNSYYLWILIIPFCIMFSMVMWYLVERNCNVYLHKKRVAFRASPLNKI
ncbi:acyltransferase [Pseudoalteromonas sp. FUC4]|uniref:acyltransferase family protein n=1 Tax=Pseudoalteromonas sp. FUC4 TaxID=2511201 RepID=UPI0011F1C4B0|nr:acyltransferase [Pseudoalteromonas sp. FUC4]KAA1152449.1 acyltransferase [Pseudoalteromonas sp. FUC4]